LLDDGGVGASVAVFVDGEAVVDVWGGFADADRTVPWQRKTITKGIGPSGIKVGRRVLYDEADPPRAARAGVAVPHRARWRARSSNPAPGAGSRP
jgi:hypothetical protein